MFIKKLDNKILRWKLFFYKLPLSDSLVVNKNRIKVREGFILKIENNEGIFSLGEIAPLKGVHIESIQQVKDQIINMLETNTYNDNCFPSIKFGFEMVWNIFLTKINNNFLNTLQNLSSPQVHALISRNDSDLINSAIKIKRNGYKHVKVKIGGSSLEHDIKNVKLLGEILGPSISIKLDVNQQWTLDEVFEFSEKINISNIDYCEEPLKKISDLSTLLKYCKLPIALDESIWNIKKNIKIPWENLNTLIIKPNRLGGVKGLNNLLKISKNYNLKNTFSSCFETGLGLTWIAMINSQINKSGKSLGIDTYRVFEKDICIPKFEVKRGKFIFPQQNLNFNAYTTAMINSGKVKQSFFEDNFKFLFRSENCL